MITILMPCHELNYRIPDDYFREEFDAAKLHGFKIILFDFDSFIRDSETILKNPDIANISVDDNTFIGPMIYRGYMLSDQQYELLHKWLSPKFDLINTPKEYNKCHYFPEVYEYVKDYTAKTVWFTDINEENVTSALKQLNTQFIFLKDFVKSAKGVADFSLREKKLRSQDWLDIILRFKTHRGKLFNKGIVMKEHLKFKRYGTQTNEWRCVFFNKKLVSISQNSNLNDVVKPNISWLFPIAAKIPSNFFTIDIAELEDGSYTIIETGDGQVSGPAPGQNMLEYYAKLAEYSAEYQKLNI